MRPQLIFTQTRSAGVAGAEQPTIYKHASKSGSLRFLWLVKRRK